MATHSIIGNPHARRADLTLLLPPSCLVHVWHPAQTLTWLVSTRLRCLSVQDHPVVLER